MEISLYSQEAREVKLRWRSFDPTASLYSREYSKEAVPGWSNINITEWRLSNVTITQRDRAVRNGNFSFVRATFKLERDSGYYERYVIGAVVLYVVIAWFSFLIDRAASPARVQMGIILFLVINSQITSQLAQLPRAADSVWLLQFMSISQIFVFYAIIE